MSENNGHSLATKDYNAEEVARRSVIQPPPTTSRVAPLPASGFDSQLFWLINQYADEITPWGARHKLRDQQLRAFIIQENIFASALGIICSRNAGFSWKTEGPQRTARVYQEVLENADNGKGWHSLIDKTTVDLSSQDNGAFWELVRMEDSPVSPVIGVNHLDAARCWHTGIQDTPVVYQDVYGHWHQMRDHNVIEFSEMPAAIEQWGFYGLQYSVLTRMLRSMQTTKNISVYDYEKTGGRNTKLIHLVKGITTQQLTDAINNTKNLADNMGYTRYVNPVLVGTLDPKADVGHDTINLVDLPDNYDEDKAFGKYINLIAMAFATDYQEFAPLPGQRLGTGAQSEILHLKARGKGPGTFMHMITRAINFKIMPRNTRFLFNEQDMEAEKTDAEVRALRAQTRAVRIASGEITPEVARQIAQDDGDLKYEYVQLMGEQDVTPDVTVQSESPSDVQFRDIIPGQPGPKAPLNAQQHPEAKGPAVGSNTR